MPTIGFGTYGIKQSDVGSSVYEAIKSGYRVGALHGDLDIARARKADKVIQQVATSEARLPAKAIGRGRSNASVTLLKSFIVERTFDMASNSTDVQLNPITLHLFHFCTSSRQV